VNVQQAPPPSRAEVADTRRLINDGIASSAELLDDEVILFEFLCECGASSCDEVVHLTVAQYHVRRVGAVVAHPTL